MHGSYKRKTIKAKIKTKEKYKSNPWTLMLLVQTLGPPASPWYKVNTDAAILSATNSVGIGVVIREAPATAPWPYWSWSKSNGWSRTFCLRYQDPRCYLQTWFMHLLSCSLGFGLSQSLLPTSQSLLQEFRSF